jgi:DNA-binding response OmpR family regulator
MARDAPPVAVEHVAPNGRHDHPFRRVLIVEDEATLRRIVARNLTGRGLQVDEAESAESALGAVARQRPDLLLLDINLPDRTGWDVLRELRHSNTEVPTIVISAVRANPSRLAEFPLLAYLPKPFPLEALLRLVFETPGRPSRGETKKEGDV